MDAIATANEPGALREPIVIVSPGRSGSTMLYRLLARHPALGWLGTYQDVAPALPRLAALNRLYARPAFARMRDERWFPKPFSPYRFWQRYLPDIARHDRPLVADDVPPDAIEPLRRTIACALRYQGKPRFLMKVTGWARITYFDRIFPDARFLYLRRDPLSVVESWMRAGWLNVTGEVGSDDWEWGAVPSEYMDVWNDLGGGPLLSAAMKTQLDIDDIRRNVAMLPHRCHEVSYEQLVSQPVACVRALARFCALQWSEEFERVIEATVVRDYSERWRRSLSEEDAETVRSFFRRIEEISPVRAAS